MLTLLFNNISLYMSGIGMTLSLTLLSALIGLVVALILSYVNVKKTPLLYQIIQLYLFVIRGTPFLLQLFIIYYGLISFNFIAHSIFADLFKSAYACALMALTINTSAYTTVFLSHAIKNINTKEILAAKNLGFTKIDILKSIILPKVMMETLPVYSNELIMLIKCTAITSSITIIDVMGATQQIIGMTYQTIPCLIIAGTIYLLLNVVIVLPSKVLYKKYTNKIHA
jgi:His/Glu/Gln/Arg/opine family amino acid ABC transporter permease subunit